MIIAGHQPDLLPHPAFFYKMAKADIFDLKIYDQYVSKGYQRRVKMRDKWAGVAVVDDAGSYAPIADKRIDPVESSVSLAMAIEQRYFGSRYWKERGPELCEKVSNIHTDRLWQFNLELILIVRDILSIRTPVSIGLPTVGKGVIGLISVLKLYGEGNTYLSGTGARAYMGDCAEFKAAGIDVVWSKHKAVTSDSILSVIMDYQDPLEIVLLEETEEMESSK